MRAATNAMANVRMVLLPHAVSVMLCITLLW